MQVDIKLIGCCLIFMNLLSCGDNEDDIQDKTSNRKAPQSTIKDEKPITTSTTTTTIDTDADLQRKAKVSVPIFQNELANKLVGRLHAIQIAKAANGSTPDLQKQEDVVMQEIASIRSLLIGEEDLMMNQFLAALGFHDGHQH